MEKKDLIPSYIRNLQVYQSGKPIDDLVREKGLTKVSKLASNENPLGPSPKALKAMQEALSLTHFYPDQHSFNLKSKLAELYGLKKENIILGNGSEGIMSYIMRTFVRPGDQVVTSENTFIGFEIMAKGVGSHLIQVPMNKNFEFDVEAIKKNITNETRIVYLANPNNPTGTYINKQEFLSLVNVIPPHCLVILDEAYFEYAKDVNDYPNSMDYRFDNVITLRTFSKAYGLAGVRIGYGFAHEELISNLTKVKLPFEPNILAQKAALAALDDVEHLENTLALNKEQYKKTFSYLEKKGLSPIASIANFITFKAHNPERATEIYEQLLDLGVIIRPLKANGMPAHLRVSLGTVEQMDHFYQAFDEVYSTRPRSKKADHNKKII